MNRKCIFYFLLATLIGFSIGTLSDFYRKDNKYDVIEIDTFVIRRIINNVTMSVYQPTREQCDEDFLITADGSKIDLKHLNQNRIKWCAVSRDLWILFPKDKPKLIEIEGLGVFEVRDVMNKRYKKRIDILIHPNDKYRTLKKDITVKIIN